MTKERQRPQPEPRWYLRSLPYSSYRGTDHWKQRKREFLNSFVKKHGRLFCEACEMESIGAVIFDCWRHETPLGQECNGRQKGAILVEWIETRPRPPIFDIDHLTYDRLGEEADEDLQLLCRPCHNAKHYPDSTAAGFWRDVHRSGAPY